jgi:long-chain fatty acid transport protein
MKLNKLVVTLLSAGVLASPLAHATNGMLMEGYGPIASGMGGASMAYDNGAAGMANNPATLGLMADNSSRIDVAIAALQPDVNASCSVCTPTGGSASAKSGGTAYYMPAGGYVKKDGAFTYGVGIFAQGGMGTEYTSNDWVSGGTGKATRSEVGVGNIIVPLAYSVSPDLNIAGSLDLVWGGMDLLMAMSGGQMAGLASTGNLSGSMMTPVGPFIINSTPASVTNLSGMLQSGYFSFSDNSKFTGQAKATGYSGKLGVTYKINPQLTFGASYHAKTSLGDLTTSTSSMTATLTQAASAAFGATSMKYNGSVAIINFQFPETYGFGFAYQADKDLMLVADYKRIGWKNVMKGMNMTFNSADNGGLSLNMTLPQNWSDQNVYSFGGAYKATDALTLRAGASFANNPVPDSLDNPLFPAIEKNSYTMGFGYAFDKANQVNGSLAFVPKVTANTAATPVSPAYSVTHSQLNWQLMYSHNF